MQDQQEELDEVVDVFQDAQAISDEINYQQDQINDIINQNTDQITGTFHYSYLILDYPSTLYLVGISIYKINAISINNYHHFNMDHQIYFWVSIAFLWGI
jgi:hypothetical protein